MLHGLAHFLEWRRGVAGEASRVGEMQARADSTVCCTKNNNSEGFRRCGRAREGEGTSKMRHYTAVLAESRGEWRQSWRISDEEFCRSEDSSGSGGRGEKKRERRGIDGEIFGCLSASGSYGREWRDGAGEGFHFLQRKRGERLGEKHLTRGVHL
jgi:hypothetical protein